MKSVEPSFLLPVKKFQSVGGVYTFPSRSVAGSMDAADDLGAGQLAEDLGRLGRKMVFVPAAKKPDLSLIRDASVDHPEGYVLSIEKKGIMVKASTPAGIYYGIQTIRDLVSEFGGRLPCCRIEDEPRFNRRGLYHDCSRGKVPEVGTVKSLIELLSTWKINELQLYIENVFAFRKHPDIGRGFSPYTARDILEIQDHCEKYHVRFVPSLSSFGHMEKILMLEKYKRLGEYPGWSGMPGGLTLCPVDPGSIKLVADLYSEFVPLFKSGDFNVCCDEPWELGKGRSKTAADRIGRGRVYLDFILKLRGLCLKYGKRMNMWGDIVLEHPEILPLLPKDLVMLNWDYGFNNPRSRIAQTAKFSDNGLPLVCCTGTNAWSTNGSMLSRAYRNVEDFTAEAVRHSAEGILHTDWGDGGHRNTLAVSLCSVSHAAGFAWAGTKMRTEGHTARFCRRVFGDSSGRMEKMLEILSDESNGHWTYTAAYESIRSIENFYNFYGQGRWYASPDWKKLRSLTFTPEFVEKRRGDLAGLNFRDRFGSGDRFLNEMLVQFDLAARMDGLAWERLGVHRALSGKNAGLPKALLSSHREHCVSVRDLFEKTWLRTNRRSRLDDNLYGFNRTIAELDSLIG